MKITLKHLAPYLPYELKVQYVDSLTNRKKKAILTQLGDDCIETTHRIYKGCKGDIIRWEGHNSVNDMQVKPILRPLSDYTDITSKAMSDLDCDLTNQMDIQEFALKKMSLSSLLYSSFEVLTRNHVDIFGLIPEGLAIDINTL